MPWIRIVTGAILAFAIVAAPVAAAAADMRLRTELERIAHSRIFFGHQSVGENLLDGIKQLAGNAGIAIRISEVPAAQDVMPSTLGHTLLARNGEPLQKLQSFEHAMGQPAARLDIAMMKFCYADFTADTDAQALFSSYRNTIERLRAKNPGTTFVHFTAPLTSVPSGFKARLKDMLGRGAPGANMRREEYNALLRATYQGREPIFDLAKIESTAPDGSAVTVAWNGNSVAAMAPDYTDDGGHLNSAGKIHAARELISVLAAIPNHPDSGAGK